MKNALFLLPLLAVAACASPTAPTDARAARPAVRADVQPIDEGEWLCLDCHVEPSDSLRLSDFEALEFGCTDCELAGDLFLPPPSSEE